MTACCSYQDCKNRHYPCSNMTFFNLPRDKRRQLWVQNSGNPQLMKEKLSPNAYRLFCEEHFDPNLIRRQFNRAILRKNAVPYAYSVSSTNTQVQQTEPNILKEVTETQEYFVTKRTSAVFETSEGINQQQDVESRNQTDEDDQSYNEDECKLEVDELIDEGVEELSYEKNGSDSEMLDEISIILDVEDNRGDAVERNLNFQEEETPINLDNRKCLRNIKIRSSSDITKICTPVSVDKKIDGIGEKSDNSSVQIKRNVDQRDYQEDMHFAMSLVGYFQRMAQKQKGRAKLNILAYLTEIDSHGCSDIL